MLSAAIALLAAQPALPQTNRTTTLHSVDTEKVPTSVKVDTLLESSYSWDGASYKAYPSARPQLTVRRITIAPRSTLQWHSHPMPNVAYVVSGHITVEKKDGTSMHFQKGQVIAEIVDGVHRGITGSEPAVLIVFYAGTPGLPLSLPDK